MRPATGFMQYRAGKLAADQIIHLIGSLAGVVGSAILVGIAAGVADRPTFLASLVYSVCLLTMLGCSAAYHLASNASRREFLRQLDHAAIFLMIAGTYTPFTTCRLHGVWGIAMTAAVWTGAITGVVMKLIGPRGVARGSIVAYLTLGWMILVGLRPNARLGGRLDRGFDRRWGRALFRRSRLSPLANAALPQRNMAQLRAGRSQLSLRSYSAWRGVGTIVSTTSPRSENAALIAMTRGRFN
jgi:hemolysin III